MKTLSDVGVSLQLLLKSFFVLEFPWGVLKLLLDYSLIILLFQINAIKHSSSPLLQKFLGTDEGLDLKILSRGLRPTGGGKVRFTCPSKLELRPSRNMEESRLIRSIRSMA